MALITPTAEAIEQENKLLDAMAERHRNSTTARPIHTSRINHDRWHTVNGRERYCLDTQFDNSNDDPAELARFRANQTSLYMYCFVAVQCPKCGKNKK